MGKKQVPNPSCNKQNPFKWYLKESPNCLYRRYYLGVGMGSWAQAAPAGMMRWWMGLVPMLHEERSYGDREFYEWEETAYWKGCRSGEQRLVCCLRTRAWSRKNGQTDKAWQTVLSHCMYRRHHYMSDTWVKSGHAWSLFVIYAQLIWAF